MTGELLAVKLVVAAPGVRRDVAAAAADVVEGMLACVAMRHPNLVRQGGGLGLGLGRQGSYTGLDDYTSGMLYQSIDCCTNRLLYQSIFRCCLSCVCPCAQSPVQ